MFNVKDFPHRRHWYRTSGPAVIGHLSVLWLVTWLIENKALSENVFAGSRADTIQNERDFIELQICRVNIFDRRAGECI